MDGKKMENVSTTFRIYGWSALNQNDTRTINSRELENSFS